MPAIASTDKELLSTIDSIYAAAIGESSWQQPMRAIRDLMGLSHAGVHCDDVATGTSVVQCMNDFDPDWQERYERYYAARNVWLLRSQHLLEPGRVIDGQEMISTNQYRRTEYYNDYGRYNDIGLSIAACLEKRPNLFTLVAVFRPLEAGSFSSRDRRLLEILAAHLRRATEATNRFRALERRASLAESALDELSVGVLLLDGNGGIAHANRTALEMHARSPFLADLTGDVFASRSGRKRLAEIRARRNTSGAGGAFQLRRTDLHPDLEVLVLPMPRKNMDRTVRWCVLIMDPLRSDPASPELLQQLHGLTAAEAEVACLLATGRTPGEVAHQRRVSGNTLKTQTRSIYLKLGVTSQAELTSRLAKLP